MKEINQIAFCSIMAALSVTIMFFGSIFCHSYLPISACCGYVLAIVIREVKLTRAVSCYFVVVALASLFIARKIIVIDYTMFSGIYPILESKISKIKQPAIRVVAKTIFFAICSTIILNISLLITGLNNVKTEKIKLISYIIFIGWYFCFDFFLQDLKQFYENKLKPTIFKYCFSN